MHLLIEFGVVLCEEQNVLAFRHYAVFEILGQPKGPSHEEVADAEKARAESSPHVLSKSQLICIPKIIGKNKATKLITGRRRMC